MQDVVCHGDVACAWVILLHSGKLHKKTGVTGRENWGRNPIASHLSDTTWLSHNGLKAQREEQKMALNFETFIAFKTKISWICSIQTAQIKEFNLSKTNL